MRQVRLITMSTVYHTTYFPIKRCSTCKQDKPSSIENFRYNTKAHTTFDSRCRECDRVRQRLQKRKFRAEHPEREKASKQRYYAKNGAAVRAGVNDYRKRNPDKVSAGKKKHAAANVEQCRAQGHRYRARKRNLPNDFTEHDWNVCLEYFGYCCAACGRQRGLWHTIVADHWIPLKKGGGTVRTNLVPLCHSINMGAGGCNGSKHDKDANQWLIEKFGKRKAKQILARIEAYFVAMQD
jgi:hypothetical protein